MNKIYVYNSDLVTSQSEDMDVKIYGLTTNDLVSTGWLFDNGYPTYKFMDLLKDIRRVSPVKWSDKVVFWDTIDIGFGLYNHAYDDWNQVIEEE